jgi:aryl-alcohol dehydrogenase-like predicted oxidoreductase
VTRACEESLRRLGTDHIDVYLLHRPDPETPIAETLGALNVLVDQGKVREIGCSNFSAEQLDESVAAAAAGGLRSFVTVQNQYSLVHRDPEAEVLPAVERLGLSFMPYFPLASGVLTGKYRRGEPVPSGTRLGGSGGEVSEKVIDESKLTAAERLTEFARSRGHTLLELALSWLAAKPVVATVIAGATSVEQVRANEAATTAWTLTDEDLARVDELLQ